MVVKKREKVEKSLDKKGKRFFVVDPYSRYGYSKALFPISMVEKYIDMQFENLSLHIPLEYDRYLRIIYNDYMKLPPIEERIAHLPSEIDF